MRRPKALHGNGMPRELLALLEAQGGFMELEQWRAELERRYGSCRAQPRKTACRAQGLLLGRGEISITVEITRAGVRRLQGAR